MCPYWQDIPSCACVSEKNSEVGMLQNVTLEMSLKPFRQTDDVSIDFGKMTIELSDDATETTVNVNVKNLSIS